MIGMTEPRLDLNLCAEALFASTIQESEHLTEDRIRAGVAEALERLHVNGVAAVMAQEAGDHPDLCHRRMRWAIRTVLDSYRYAVPGIVEGGSPWQ
jgi:hypothetical protein